MYILIKKHNILSTVANKNPIQIDNPELLMKVFKNKPKDIFKMVHKNIKYSFSNIKSG